MLEPLYDENPLHIERESTDVPTILPPTNAKKLEALRPTDIEKRLHQSIVGQDKAIAELAKLYIKVKSGIRSIDGKPIDSIFLDGPSGVGKTESVLAFLMLFLEAGEDPKTHIARIDGGQFQAWHEVSKLTGAPPGYKGHVDTPALFEPDTVEKTYKVKYKDAQGKEAEFWIVLVDEIEKADDAIHKALLSALDKGTLTLGNNKTVSFQDAIFFFTSNLGTQELEQRRSGFVVPFINPDHVIAQAYAKKFPPEFRGRITKRFTYQNLSFHELDTIIDLHVRKIEKLFLAHGTALAIKLDPTLRANLLKDGYSRSEGARALGKIIDREILDELALIDRIKLHGNEIFVEKNREGTIEFRIVGSCNVQIPPQAEKKKKIQYETSNEVRLERMEKAVTNQGYVLGNGTGATRALPYERYDASTQWPPRFSILTKVKSRPFSSQENYLMIGEFALSQNKNWCIWVFGEMNLEPMQKMADVMSKTIGSPVILLLQRTEPIRVVLK